MTIRLYETKMEFDYDSADGTAITTHTVYIESDGLYFDGKITGTGSPGIFIDSTVAPNSSGLSNGDFEFQRNQIAFGTQTLFTNPAGDGVIFSGTIGATLDSVASNPLSTGFSSGGYTQDGGPNTMTTNIDKFPFAITAFTATSVGDLAVPSHTATGASSTTHGFNMGGQASLSIPTTARIDKFPFSIDGGTGVEIGNLSQSRSSSSGHNSSTHAFTTGGTLYTNIYSNVDKFPFAQTSGTLTKVADLNNVKRYNVGYSDQVGEQGFSTGGTTLTPSPFVSLTIEKFPFAISSGIVTATGGQLSDTRGGFSGVQDTVNAFAAGGFSPVPGSSPVNRNTILKFPFAISSGTSTNVGTLASSPNGATYGHERGASSNDDGFLIADGATTLIHKFPFAISSGTTTAVGNLSHPGSTFSSIGHQV